MDLQFRQPREESIRAIDVFRNRKEQNIWSAKMRQERDGSALIVKNDPQRNGDSESLLKLSSIKRDA